MVQLGGRCRDEVVLLLPPACLAVLRGYMACGIPLIRSANGKGNGIPLNGILFNEIPFVLNGILFPFNGIPFLFNGIPFPFISVKPNLPASVNSRQH